MVEQFPDVDSKGHQHYLCLRLVQAPASEAYIGHVLLQLSEGPLRLDASVHPDFDSFSASEIVSRSFLLPLVLDVDVK